MKIHEIKPLGNFKEILETLRKRVDSVINKCNKEQKYNSSISDCIKLIINELGIIDALESGIINEKGWDMDEMIKCLLYTHLMIIDLNDTAHKYLNGIEPQHKISQLQDYINTKKSIYNNITIEE